MTAEALAEAGQAEDGTPRGARTRGRRWRHFSPTLVLAWLIIALVVAWAIAPRLFTHANPDSGVALSSLQAPSAAHWFGTDDLGRDVLTRVINGSVHSLAGALVAAA